MPDSTKNNPPQIGWPIVALFLLALIADNAPLIFAAAVMITMIILIH